MGCYNEWCRGNPVEGDVPTMPPEYQQLIIERTAASIMRDWNSYMVQQILEANQ